ncbi:MAG: gliding motility-associated C-terminal domain-containing protein [Brumimicrobium sp.]
MKLHVLLLLVTFMFFSNDLFSQCCGDGNCDPGETAATCPSDCGGSSTFNCANTIGSFFDSPSWPVNYATASSNGWCYTIDEPYPTTVCFEYVVPPVSDAVRVSFAISGCNTSGTNQGNTPGGCNGANITNSVVSSVATFDNDCNQITSNMQIGGCYAPGDIITVCINLNQSAACGPITICPVLNCGTSECSTDSGTTFTCPPFDFSINGGYSDPCVNNSGYVVATPDCGDHFSYLWNDPLSQTDSIATGLSAGTYDVLVTNSAFPMCDTSMSFTLDPIMGFSVDTILSENPSCSGDCDGEISAFVSGGSGNFSYAWFDSGGNPVGTNTSSITNLCSGDYSVEITDNGGSGTITIFSEDFETGGTGWNLNVSLGGEGSDPNYFVINDNEGGVPPGGCGVAGNGDATLHITSAFFPNGGAAYDAGGLCGLLYCPETHRRAESPVINTTGYSGLTLNFDYIANGSIPNDQATVWYNDGSGWNQLGTALNSGVCTSGQGLWSVYSHLLPASCDNNPNLQIAIQWDNNDDGVGTDPSVAINNLSIVTTGTSTPCTTTEFVTISDPSSVNPSFTLDNFCEGAAVAATNVTPAGGVFSFNPAPSDGATINPTTGMISGGNGGNTYSVTYTLNGGGTCPVSVIESVQVYSVPEPVITGTFQYCTGGSALLDAGSGYDSYSWSTGESTQTISTTTSDPVFVTVTDANGCQGTSDPVNITESTTIVYNSIIEICDGENAVIHGVSQSTSGIYSETFTTGSGCDSTSNVQLVVHPLPNPIINGDLVYCHGEFAHLNVVGNYDSYLWSTGETTPTIATTTSLPITVTVTDINGCSAISPPVSLDGPPIASVSATPSEGESPLEVLLTNNSQNGITYYWDFGNDSTLMTNNTSSQVQVYDSLGTYTVMLIAEKNGCVDTAYVTIIITNDLPLIVEFPNVFTPNGDNTNDFFLFKGVNAKELEIFILNRWGEDVYHSTDVDFKWDGVSSRGKEVTDGVYFYKYKITGFNKEIVEGHGYVHVSR